MKPVGSHVPVFVGELPLNSNLKAERILTG
jgi:hypothetical protein